MNVVHRAHLEALVADRNSGQKHVWRARIVLLTEDGLEINEILRRTGKSKVTIGGLLAGILSLVPSLA